MGMAFLRVVNTNGENANGNTENVDPDEVSDDSLWPNWLGQLRVKTLYDQIDLNLIFWGLEGWVKLQESNE